jgi:hypothetical protein
LQVAFFAAVEEARYEYGHGGYTGTIAEKADVVLRSPKTFTLAEARAFARIDIEDNEKYEPAFAVRVKDDKYGEGWYVYGYAAE